MLALLKNRIKRFPMELVLTPRGKDMIPVLGPVVTISPTHILSHTFIYIQQLFWDYFSIPFFPAMDNRP
jgi:hypothetical protein